MPNPIDGPAPVLSAGPRCGRRGYRVGPDKGIWACGAQPGHGGRVHVVYRSATWEPEVWFSWPTAEAEDEDEYFFIVEMNADDEAVHEHRHDGQTIRHAHAAGGDPHGHHQCAGVDVAPCQSCSRGEDGGGYPCDCPAACGARYCQHPTETTGRN